ncbi:MAG: PDZ domain-containing protein [Nitriliruptorales bacterium]|nr:PDZ domain-containing protein [Nitriliruptorales bacterium]
MYVAIFVVSLVFAIMFHEFGHYATAKAFGMKVQKFFLGFGPTLWSVRRGETEYGVKAIPAGGFVRIVGMSALEEIDPADRGRTFFEQAAWKRLIVLSAGSVTHFVLAGVLIFAALTFIGLPVEPGTDVDVVLEGSPAAAAGVRPGDRITAVNGQPVETFEEVRDLIAVSDGDALAFTIRRDRQEREVEITPASQRPDGTQGAFVGIGPPTIIEPVPPGESLRRTIVGDYSVVAIARQNLTGLGQALNPDALARWFGQVDDPGPRSTDGPLSLVGVGQAVNALGQSGAIFEMLFLFAILNITLGTLNMLPLPPLDGGHVAVLLVEQAVNGVRRIGGRAPTWRLDPTVIMPLALAVIAFFVVLSVTALYVDIVKPASQLLEQ